MAHPLVLVANEPRSYRDALAIGLSVLRPEVEVVAVEPDDLDREIRSRHPVLAVCSQLSEAVERYVASWVVLYPEGARLVASGGRDRLDLHRDLTLDDLAALIDRATDDAAP